jgi:hypothetical protein
MAREARRRSTRDTSSYTEPDEDVRDKEEDDEDEQPRSRGTRRRSQSESKPAARRSSRDEDDDDDDDDDERPARRRGAAKKPTGTHGSGWGAFNRNKSQTSEFPQDLKITDEALLIKFLEAEPFTSYLQHWIDEAPSRKSFTCLGDDCPLCDIGAKKQARTCFNVIEWTDLDHPTVKVWNVSPTLGEQLHNLANDKKTSPLDREDLYWSVSKAGGGKKGSRVTYSILPVKARDLEDDWDLEPLTADELEEFQDKAFTDEEVVRYDSRAALRQLADSLED